MPGVEINLLDLSLRALFGYLVLIGFADTVGNILFAIKNGNFSAAYVADFIRTHIILRLFAIGFLGILGHGVPLLDMPAIPIVSAAAGAALVAYLVETVASLKEAATGGKAGTVPFPTPPTPTPEG